MLANADLIAFAMAIAGTTLDFRYRNHLTTKKGFGIGITLLPRRVGMINSW